MLSIDRFEGNTAICEDEIQNIITLPRNEIPKDAKEGDILAKDDTGQWKIDYAAVKKRRSSLFRRLCKLANK